MSHKTTNRAASKKRYISVAEMVRDLSEDQAFAEQVSRRIEERNIINHLMAMRTLSGMSQKDIASKMLCTQSRISKLESGKDDELRIGDFHAYAEALGLQMMIVLAKKGQPRLAEQINYHTSALNRLYRKLAELVGDDNKMTKEMLKLIRRNTLGLVTELSGILESALRAIPQPETNAPSPIQIEMQEDKPACTLDDDCPNETECQSACQV